MNRKQANINQAKEIIGKWGYEEKEWWEPIAKALQAKDNKIKHLLDKERCSVLDEAIAIFEELPEDEMMTKNPVILELKVLKENHEE